MRNSFLSQQLPQDNTKGIDVHSWHDRVLWGLLRGVLVLANGTQQLWGRIARVAHLQFARKLGETTDMTSSDDNGHLHNRAGAEQLSGCIIKTGFAMSSLHSQQPEGRQLRLLLFPSHAQQMSELP